jgi:hypothetical protein
MLEVFGLTCTFFFSLVKEFGSKSVEVFILCMVSIYECIMNKGDQISQLSREIRLKELSPEMSTLKNVIIVQIY